MRTVIVSLLLIGVPGTLSAATLEGTLRLEGSGDASPAEAVVTFRPARAAALQAPSEPFEMLTEDKEFRPRVLVVPAGSAVRFPNRDPILHNVFSVSGDNAFDLGFYREGESREVVFEHPGLVRVFCNVHHSMVAYVLVVDTSFVARPDSRGRFRFEDLPPGDGTLEVWHERAEPVATEVSTSSPAPLSLTLEVTKPRVPKHLNKLGKPYDRTRRYR